jgi:hypothetical protein
VSKNNQSSRATSGQVLNAARGAAATPPPVSGGTLDPGQREYELADALMTLVIAVSRYNNSAAVDRATPTAERLVFLRRLTTLLAQGVAERVEKLEGKPAAAEFRKGLGKRGSQ